MHSCNLPTNLNVARKRQFSITRRLLHVRQSIARNTSDNHKWCV